MMNRKVSRSPKPGRHSKTGIPAEAWNQLLEDLTEWFIGFGFDADAARAKALAWLHGEEIKAMRDRLPLASL